MNIGAIGDRILDEHSSPAELRDAMDAFLRLCSDITGIQPDPSFDAWADDSLLDSGVAINPQAAAHCAVDYQRSVMFIRGVYAAINSLKIRFPNTPLEILYAGCGPFATLLLPLLCRFQPGELRIHLLDIHQRSLDSVEGLLNRLGFNAHAAHTIRANACHYQHPHKLHLVIAETMQKALEQEPQFAVTANLAPQLCTTGIFIPQRIAVDLILADLDYEKRLFARCHHVDDRALEETGKRHPIARVCDLTPYNAAKQISLARYNANSRALELKSRFIDLPVVSNPAHFDPALFTRIDVFEQYQLGDYESEITLPARCHELMPIIGGQRYRVSYQLGSYPKFYFESV